MAITLEFRTPASGMSLSCPPVGVNVGPSSCDDSGLTGPRADIQRLSNLDLNGKLVKKGVVVSVSGFRYSVTRVNRGYMWGKALDCYGRCIGTYSHRMQCESVQVV